MEIVKFTTIPFKPLPTKLIEISLCFFCGLKIDHFQLWLRTSAVDRQGRKFTELKNNACSTGTGLKGTVVNRACNFHMNSHLKLKS